MASDLSSLLRRDFAVILIMIAAIASSLFAVLGFLVTPHVSLATGLLLFLAITFFLIIGYALGIIMLSFFVVLFLTSLWRKKG